MAQHIINGIKIHTTHVFPPIPDRRFDWCAWDDDLGEDCSRHGWGPTEAAAIADLMQQLETTSPEDTAAALIEQCFSRPTKDTYDETLSRVSEEMSCPETTGSPSPSHSSAASSSES